MHPAFYRKILTLVDLDQDDFEILNRLICTSETYKRRRDIARVGEQPSFLCIVLEGWAARYSLRTDGSRRITGILMPGDFCGIHAVSAAVMDHAITALTTCKIGKIELRELENALRSVPKLVQADLGDALGLTAVHVNRMLRELREQGLVEFSNMRLTIPDVPALHAASGFDPQYLYLNIPRYSE